MIGSSSHDGPITCNPMQVIDGYREIVEASRPVQSIAYMNKIVTNYTCLNVNLAWRHILNESCYT